MLGAVLVLMRQLQQPETVAQIDRIFTAQGEKRAAGLSGGEGPEKETKPREELPGEPEAWNKVEDNSIFLEAENEAWFLLWAKARGLSPADLKQRSLGVASYAQLAGQPDVYRGQAVTIKGRVLQETAMQAPSNELGIDDYHQLIVAPVGGGDFPITIYCLALPPGFPRGGKVAEDVSIAGLFFKTWSYPYDGGMGISPVLIAPTFEWNAPITRTAANTPQADMTPLYVGAAAGVLCALWFVVWVSRQTRRPSACDSLRPDFRQLDAEP